MVFSYEGKTFQLHRQVGLVSQSKVNDARVWLTLPKDQLAEVPIVRNQNAALGCRDGEHLSVTHATRMLATDTGRIVTEGPEKRTQAGVATLVEQELHQRASV